MSWTVPANGRHTSGFGPRNTGIPGASTYHRGYDIAPPVPGQRGVTVHAVGPGVVAGVDTNTYRGRYIRIRHDDRSMTLYQHLDRIDVKVGQRVTTGQRVGLMGSTGVGAGVHLHFECYEAGVNAYVLANAVDPVAYLSRRGVRLVEASTVSKPLPIGGALPGAPGGALPDPLTPEDTMTPELKAYLDQMRADILQQIGNGAQTSANNREVIPARTWGTPVKGRPEGPVPAIQELADAKTHAMQAARDAAAILALVKAQTTNPSAAAGGLAEYDVDAIATAAADEIEQRLARARVTFDD